MAFQKPTYNYIAAWVGVFLCIILTQTTLDEKQQDKPALSNSEANLLQNAIIPVYLSEDRSASIRQLENLVQGTDIRQIHIYTSDQQLVAQVLNASAPTAFRETQIENMPMTFQGTMAGSVQLDIAYAKIESKAVETFQATASKSLAITFIAWVLVTLYLSISKWLLPRLHTKNRAPGVLESRTTEQQNTETSLLLYVYPLPEAALSQEQAAKQECLGSFSNKLENHLRIYGGRILSVSEKRIVCRMAAGQSQADLQQALTFCWGIARPMLYRHNEQTFRLEVRSLLHRTRLPAKSGNLYRAISEVDARMEAAVTESPQGAHISEQLLSALDSSSNFDHIKSKEHPDVHAILSVKKSVDALWQKQELMVAATSQ